jgi:hypothetical protein
MAHTAFLSSQAKLQPDLFLDPGTTQHMYYQRSLFFSFQQNFNPFVRDWGG